LIRTALEKSWVVVGTLRFLSGNCLSAFPILVIGRYVVPNKLSIASRGGKVAVNDNGERHGHIESVIRSGHESLGLGRPLYPPCVLCHVELLFSRPRPEVYAEWGRKQPSSVMSSHVYSSSCASCASFNEDALGNASSTEAGLLHLGNGGPHRLLTWGLTPRQMT
jgi:hypothetical protein